MKTHLPCSISLWEHAEVILRTSTQARQRPFQGRFLPPLLLAKHAIRLYRWRGQEILRWFLSTTSIRICWAKEAEAFMATMSIQ